MKDKVNIVLSVVTIVLLTALIILFYMRESWLMVTMAVVVLILNFVALVLRVRQCSRNNRDKR